MTTTDPALTRTAPGMDSAMTHDSVTTPAPTTDATLRIRNLTKRFRTTTALDGFDLTLDSGRIVGLLGENGCGKTTLMKVIAGVLDEFDGDVTVCGRPIGAESKAITAFLPDAEFLSREWRVRTCLDYFDDFFADFDREKASGLIRHFGFDEGMRLKEMSKGMREKVQIALIMSRRAKLYLLDEPISGVDPAARDVILDGLLRSLDDDSVLLISTHLIHDLEPVIDTVVMMRHGKVILTGDADDLRAEHGRSLDALFKEVYR